MFSFFRNCTKRALRFAVFYMCKQNLWEDKGKLVYVQVWTKFLKICFGSVPSFNATFIYTPMSTTYIRTQSKLDAMSGRHDIFYKAFVANAFNQ